MILTTLVQSDRMMGVLFFVGVISGLRVSDMLALTVGQMQQVMEVTEQKTGKIKPISFTDSQWEFISTYMEDMRPHHRLFPTTRQTVHKYFSRVAKDLGIGNIGTHSMRKTYAYNVFRSTKSIKITQKSLNHTYVGTTMGYLVSALFWAMKRVHKGEISREIQPSYQGDDENV